MAQERPTPNPEMIAELYLDEIKCFSSSNGIEEETVFPVVSRSRINFARHSGKRLAIELTIAALPWLSVSVKEVAETVKELFQGEVKIEYVEARPGDYVGKIVSNNKSKKLLNWEPKVDFKEGAKKFMDWLDLES